ncbi:MAG: four helix bundle protein [Candidatus Nomurabacteria bacterium]|nr:four helix bundle protein [Candidatus Nomurabacteria bacterium]
MPKLHRYGLGEKTLHTNLELLANLVKAKNAPRPQKAIFLIAASANVEILRFHLRLYLDLKLTGQTRVFQLQANLREIGREIGGWLKSVK